MISFVKGELAEVFDDIIVLENNGIGYNIHVPASLISNLPQIGESFKVYTYLQVREDALSLFGFLTRDDLDVFKMLINVNGIGPKAALAILSTITPDDLRFAVLSEDVKLISRAPGIGAKTAQRVIIELKDKLKLSDAFEKAFGSENKNADTHAAALNAAKNEAIEALVALGYGSSEAIRAVRQVEDVENKTSDTILKEALRKLAMF